MTRRHWVVIGLAGALLACAASGPTAISDADKTAIRANLEAYRTHALAGQWDEWGTTMTENVTYMPPNMAPLMGRAAAVTFGQAFPKLNSLTLEALDIDGQGDMASVRGRFAYNATMPDGAAAADSGSFLDVFRKQADGTWLNAQVIWHSNAPVAAPAAPPAANTRR